MDTRSSNRFPKDKNQRHDPSLKYFNHNCYYCEKKVYTHPRCEECDLLIHDILYGCSNKACIYAHSYSPNGLYCRSCTKKLKISDGEAERIKQDQASARAEAQRLEHNRQERERRKGEDNLKERERRKGEYNQKLEWMKANHRCVICKHKVDSSREPHRTVYRKRKQAYNKTIKLLRHATC